jgi:predicted Zn-dependent protease
MLRVRLALSWLLLVVLPLPAATLDTAAYDQGGEIAYRRVLQPAAAERKLNADRAFTSRVRGIANRVVVAAPATVPAADTLVWGVNVVTDPLVDVIEYPGGRLLVHSGLAQSGLGDEEIAAVLAHVIAHGLLGYDRALVSSAVAEADAGAADPNRRVIAIAEAAARVLKQRKAPPAEVEAADRMSVELMARAAYDPRAAARAWRRLGAAGGPLAERFPVTEARLAALDAAATSMVPLFEDTRAKAAAQERAPPPVGGGGRTSVR